MLTALPNSFLDPLLSFGLLEDAEIRLLVLEILVSLIDRHDNLPKFSTIRLELTRLKNDERVLNQVHVTTFTSDAAAAPWWQTINLLIYQK